MTNRRDLLKGILATGGVAALMGASPREASANWGGPEPAPNFDGSSLVNLEHAYKVMEEAGLDGLIAVNPVNVFYLTNHLGIYTKIQIRDASFAVMPRDKNKPIILIVGSGDLWSIANDIREYPNIIPYSGPKNWQTYEGKVSAENVPEAYPGFSDIWGQNTPGLSSIESQWLAMDKRYQGQFMPTPEHALLKAIKESGLAKAKVGVDSLSIVSSLKRVDHTSTLCMENDNIFRKIRVVKSEVEVEHMRVIAQANQKAAMSMLRQLKEGATSYDLDHLFRIEVAKQGAMSTWLIGGSIGGFPSGVLKKGEPFLIDAVSQINYYHGDFARTVVLDEPSKKVLDRTRLLKIGWDAALQMMRPGVRYSEIETVARKAMAGSGISVPPVAVVPHSVGLQHTDEPYRDNLPFVVKDDLVLQKNMVLTVDFPSVELGWGNCHLEDLVRITDDGVEPLGTIDDPLVII